LIDKKKILEPQHNRRTVGLGEAFPEEEKNGLKQQHNLPKEQRLNWQISFCDGCDWITRVLSSHLTSAVIGTRGWGEKGSETGNCPSSGKCLKKRAETRASGAS
jgi:hypothetical protein